MLVQLQGKPPREAFTVLWETCAREEKPEVALELLSWAAADGLQPSICDLLSLLASQPAQDRPALAEELLRVGLIPVRAPRHHTVKEQPCNGVLQSCVILGLVAIVTWTDWAFL